MMFGSVGRSVLCFARQVVQSARPISIRGQRLHFAPGPFRGTARTIWLLVWMMMKIFASKKAIILSNLGRAKDGHDLPSFLLSFLKFLFLCHILVI